VQRVQAPPEEDEFTSGDFRIEGFNNEDMNLEDFLG
jgi:hypothetical protein